MTAGNGTAVGGAIAVQARIESQLAFGRVDGRSAAQPAQQVLELSLGRFRAAEPGIGGYRAEGRDA